MDKVRSAFDGLTSIDRRTFMAAATALAASAIAPNARAAGPAVDRMIDVHCHIFNGRDVPASDFVLAVAAREQGLGDVAAHLAGFAADLIGWFAPRTESETEGVFEKGPGAVSVSDDGFKRQVFETLKRLTAKRQFSRTAYVDEPVFRHLKEAGYDVTSDAFRIDGEYASPEALSLDALQRLYGGGTRLGPRSRTPTDRELAELANTVGNRTSPRQDKFLGLSDADRYLSIVRIFDSYRTENVQRLDRTFGLNESPGTVRFYCPAIIDYDRWLDATSTSQLDQARMMAQVSKRTEANLLVNGYIAFDPLRAAIDKRHGAQNYETTLGVVRTAIHEFGFVGVKLYPPMGFRPWGNAGSGQDHGPIVKKLLAKEGITDAALDVEMDAALDALYSFCLDEDVAILAHCANSQTSFEGSGVRASPAHWQSLLERSEKHRRLRLNLGHFGNIWCLAQPPGTPDENARCQVAMDWPQKIVAMVSTGAPNNWRYPNLSFDFADLMPLADETWRPTLMDKLDQVLGTGPARTRALSRMLYGTDWMFLMFGKNYQEFLYGVRVLASRLQIPESDLLWKNASMFLGLTANAKTASRLLQFYADNPGKRDALKRLLA